MVVLTVAHLNSIQYKHLRAVGFRMRKRLCGSLILHNGVNNGLNNNVSKNAGIKFVESSRSAKL